MAVVSGGLGSGCTRDVPQPGLCEDPGAAAWLSSECGFERRVGRGAQQRRAGDDVARSRFRVEDHRHRPRIDNPRLEPNVMIGGAERVYAPLPRRWDVDLDY